jgi:hypothetical protein
MVLAAVAQVDICIHHHTPLHQLPIMQLLLAQVEQQVHLVLAQTVAIHHLIQFQPQVAVAVVLLEITQAQVARAVLVVAELVIIQVQVRRALLHHLVKVLQVALVTEHLEQDKAAAVVVVQPLVEMEIQVQTPQAQVEQVTHPQ